MKPIPMASSKVATTRRRKPKKYASAVGFAIPSSARKRARQGKILLITILAFFRWALKKRKRPGRVQASGPATCRETSGAPRRAWAGPAAGAGVNTALVRGSSADVGAAGGEAAAGSGPRSFRGRCGRRRAGGAGRRARGGSTGALRVFSCIRPCLHRLVRL